jgi:uncharacterized delta-60 repeat protein
MKSKIVFILLLFCHISSFSQPGTLDLSFGGTGIVKTSISNGNSVSKALAIQPDGKIVVVGYTFQNSKYDFAVVRYNLNGELDLTFGIDGKVLTSFGKFSACANAVVLQSDGKIIALGHTYNDTASGFALVRYTLEGNLDNTFGNNGIVVNLSGSKYDYLSSVRIQEDQKIIIAGSKEINNTRQCVLLRYNIDGTIDNTFGLIGEIITSIYGLDYIYSLSIQKDKKIIAVGENSNRAIVIRFNEDGSLDTTFGKDGKMLIYDASVYDWADGVIFGFNFSDVNIQSNDKIICVGNTWVSGLGPGWGAGLVYRFNPDGAIDSSFHLFTAKSPLRFDQNIHLSSFALYYEKIIIAGGDIESGGVVTRLNADGSKDSSFGTNGIFKNNEVVSFSDLKVQNDGKIICVSDYDNESTTSFALVRLNSETVNVQNLSDHSNFEFFPNPAKDKFSIMLNEYYSPKLELYNLEGLLIQSINLHNSINEVNIEKLPRGCYIVRIIALNKIETKRLIKQ